MKSKALLFTSFLMLASLMSCDKDNDKDNEYDDDDRIIYAITARSTQDLQAVVDYTDQYGAIINKTVDLPAKISIRESDIDNYKISGYLKTKNESNYAGELAYSVIIMEEDDRTNSTKILSEYDYSITILTNNTPADIKARTTFNVTWQD